MRFNRRQMLVGASGLFALPVLGRFQEARAGTHKKGTPKRLILFHIPQGTAMPWYLPTGKGKDFELGSIMASLEPWRNNMVIVSGVDNKMPNYNEVGNAHNNANYTLLTGQPFAEQDADNLSAAGPTIEQVIADRIGGATPFPRLDFSVGGSETTSGFFTQTRTLWYDAFDPVSYYNDPVLTILRLFGDSTMSEAELWAQRARRSSVLSAVLDNFELVRKDLGSADLERLDTHEGKLVELESRIVTGTGECNAPGLSLPAGYSYGDDDDISAPIINDILVTAMSCDYTRVGTVTFSNDHSPTFPWLWSRNGGAPIVDTSQFDNWHAMVHDDYQPGMEIAFTWYMEMFADLLDKLANTTDADGDNMLDTSMVLCFSEYSSGRHWNRNIPLLFAGTLGDGVEMGRYLNLMPGTWDDYEDAGGYLDSGYSMNQVLVSMLQAFGGSDDNHGYVDDELPDGPLPGLLS